MADNHQQAGLTTFLAAWHTVSLRQHAALNDGRLEDLAHLIDQGEALQQRLAPLIEDSPDLSPAEQATLREIHNLQESLITELSRGRNEIAENLASLRRGRSGLAGYRSNGPAPRYLNKRT